MMSPYPWFCKQLLTGSRHSQSYFRIGECASSRTQTKRVDALLEPQPTETAPVYDCLLQVNQLRLHRTGTTGNLHPVDWTVRTLPWLCCLIQKTGKRKQRTEEKAELGFWAARPQGGSPDDPGHFFQVLTFFGACLALSLGTGNLFPRPTVPTLHVRLHTHPRILTSFPARLASVRFR